MFESLKKNKQLFMTCLSIFIIGVSLIFVYYTLENIGLITNEIHTFLLLIRPVIIAFGIAYVLNRPMIYIEDQLQRLSQRLMKKEITLRI